MPQAAGLLHAVPNLEDPLNRTWILTNRQLTWLIASDRYMSDRVHVLEEQFERQQVIQRLQDLDMQRQRVEMAELRERHDGVEQQLASIMDQLIELIGTTLTHSE